MVNEFVKDDLKRSVSGFFYCVLVHRFTNLLTRQQPLQDTRAGDGRRSRDVEDYLKGILKAIRPVPGVTSAEDDTAVAALSRRKCLFCFRLDVTN